MDKWITRKLPGTVFRILLLLFFRWAVFFTELFKSDAENYIRKGADNEAENLCRISLVFYLCYGH